MTVAYMSEHCWRTRPVKPVNILPDNLFPEICGVKKKIKMHTRPPFSLSVAKLKHILLLCCRVISERAIVVIDHRNEQIWEIKQPGERRTEIKRLSVLSSSAATQAGPITDTNRFHMICQNAQWLQFDCCDDGCTGISILPFPCQGRPLQHLVWLSGCSRHGSHTQAHTHKKRKLHCTL